jgi:hypothetical protein
VFFSEPSDGVVPVGALLLGGIAGLGCLVAGVFHGAFGRGQLSARRGESFGEHGQFRGPFPEFGASAVEFLADGGTSGA